VSTEKINLVSQALVNSSSLPPSKNQNKPDIIGPKNINNQKESTDLKTKMIKSSPRKPSQISLTTIQNPPSSAPPLSSKNKPLSSSLNLDAGAMVESLPTTEPSTTLASSDMVVSDGSHPGGVVILSPSNEEIFFEGVAYRNDTKRG